MNELKELSIVLAGEAGQGIQSIETLLTDVFKRSGYYVFASKEYMSRVRGGINSIQIRISEKKINAPIERIDIFIPFNKESYHHLENRCTEKTLVIGSKQDLDIDGIIDVPFERIAKELGNKLYANMAASGFVCGMVNIESDLLHNYIQQRFDSKAPAIIEGNIGAADKGLSLGKELSDSGKIPFTFTIKTSDLSKEMMINGHQAVSLGAVAGGCNSVFCYPMTPGSGVFTVLASLAKKAGIAVEQAEDEIAAINMVVGAWFAGGRALVSTSGGGFALMTEGISLAGMTETPAVVHIAQRPGPATGLPTRTEQGDLNLAVYAGHGLFPKAVFAPGNREEMFSLMARAFNEADRFQMPVVVLTDQFLVDSYGNQALFELKDLPSAENIVVPAEETYKRYLFTDNGISPRSIPGSGPGRVCADSDEHDEEGRITEDLDGISIKMKEQRALKMEAVKNAVIPPTFYGPHPPETLLVCWGSTLEPVKEALEMTNILDIGILHFSQVFPLPSNLKEILTRSSRLIFIENNQDAAFAQLVQQETRLDTSRRILKYNGLMFTVEELAAKIKEVVNE